MILRARGKSFEMEVLGYEFPSAIDYDDANWLNIKIRASDKDQSWEASDSCLLTYELIELKQWLERISKGEKVDPHIYFLEGELAFEFNSNDNELIVELNFNFHPKGGSYKYGDEGDKKYLISFPMEKGNLNAYESINRFLEDYPERLKQLKER